MDDLAPANVSEIEFAEDGLKQAYHELLMSAPDSKDEHAAAHAYVDWLTIKIFQRHSPPCTEECPFRVPTEPTSI